MQTAFVTPGALNCRILQNRKPSFYFVVIESVSACRIALIPVISRLGRKRKSNLQISRNKACSLIRKHFVRVQWKKEAPLNWNINPTMTTVEVWRKETAIIIMKLQSTTLLHQQSASSTEIKFRNEKQNEPNKDQIWRPPPYRCVSVSYSMLLLSYNEASSRIGEFSSTEGSTVNSKEMLLSLMGASQKSMKFLLITNEEKS